MRRIFSRPGSSHSRRCAVRRPWRPRSRAAACAPGDLRCTAGSRRPQTSLLRRAHPHTGLLREGILTHFHVMLLQLPYRNTRTLCCVQLLSRSALRATAFQVCAALPTSPAQDRASSALRSSGTASRPSRSASSGYTDPPRCSITCAQLLPGPGPRCYRHSRSRRSRRGRRSRRRRRSRRSRRIRRGSRGRSRRSLRDGAPRRASTLLCRAAASTAGQGSGSSSSGMPARGPVPGGGCSPLQAQRRIPRDNLWRIARLIYVEAFRGFI